MSFPSKAGMTFPPIMMEISFPPLMTLFKVGTIGISFPMCLGNQFSNVSGDQFSAYANALSASNLLTLF